jgi:methylenetetrahydrofolate dehydrogenase (NADP+)/methenyltetrahydrofolate cyclohydrolase
LSAKVIDGKAVAASVRERVRGEVEQLSAELGRAPGLATVLVGDDPASAIYVRRKREACEEVGICSFHHEPDGSISHEELLELVIELNEADEVDGILVQLPLPGDLNSKPVLELIDPSKDVDGFHPISVGRLVANQPGLRPCTPAGVMELLRAYDIPVTGADAVVVGRSDIVGKPVALLLLHQSATVTIAHSRTRDLGEVTRRADILVTDGAAPLRAALAGGGLFARRTSSA